MRNPMRIRDTEYVGFKYDSSPIRSNQKVEIT
ncbi:hypothetical protein SAMN05216278_3337 [Halopelagius longus]|uniref:Uncharacterized protein n=1 Tax=Halopelagius longus TaxID=1236180 RepID=A0A1H1FPP0_9EURY|nr:hypothetical protein SAMN05216278_3337 [Halopelagius longus]